jgi:hypothetical protein
LKQDQLIVFEEFDPQWDQFHGTQLQQFPRMTASLIQFASTPPSAPARTAGAMLSAADFQQ